MHHVPGDLIAASHPVVLPYGVVTVDRHEILSLSGKLAVKFRSLDHYGLVGGKTGSRLAYDGKHHGKMAVELVLYGIEHDFLITVDLVPHRLTLVKR